MKVYIVSRNHYEDSDTLGAFSSYEKAEEALEHWFVAKEPGYVTWVDKHSYGISEYELDQYYNENLTKLHKALK